jgi:hypothetical protein
MFSFFFLSSYLHRLQPPTTPPRIMAAPNNTTALADPLMLDKIDKLFACGVGELVDLPQIVVVGDQSSGKSSVLEGLIRKPLPRDSGLCTRFATQIVFRRAKTEGVEVSIIPDKDAGTEHVERVKSWGRKVKEELDSEAFVKIMKEVSYATPEKIRKFRADMCARRSTLRWGWREKRMMA